MNRILTRSLFRAGTLLLVASACALVPATALGGPPEQAIETATRERLHSKVLDEDRIVDVYVPPSYAGGDDRYPVLYLLDGDAHLEHTIGLTRFLVEAGRIPELIIVAITSTDRDRDFTPPPHPKFWATPRAFMGRSPKEGMPTAGGADRFLRFLAEELVPDVEARYRTAPFRVLFGHSLGGLFALYAFERRPDLFRGIVAASPSLWWNEGALAGTLPKAAAGLPPLERAVFFAVGQEPEEMLQHSAHLDSALRIVGADRVRSRFVRLPDEDHLSTPHLTLYEGLRFVFEAWPPPRNLLDPKNLATLDFDQIIAHYTQLSRRFGYAVRPPEDLLNSIGYTLLQTKGVDVGLAAFERTAAYYPRSANVQDSLADALVRKGRFAEALVAAQRAVDFARKAGDPRLQVFETRASEWRRRAAAAREQKRP